MLLVKIINDRTGDIKTGNYNYSIYINEEKLEEGRIENHKRDEGYQKLIKKLARKLKP